MTKISIRFFNDREVRAAWDEGTSQWFFAVVDIVAVLNEQSDYTKNRNYWKYLKNKLKKENPQLVSAANQLKLTAPDGKKRLTDCFDSAGVIELAKNFPNTKATKFLDWFLYNDNTIDGQSKKKAYALFESGLLSTLEPGTVKCLQQILITFLVFHKDLSRESVFFVSLQLQPKRQDFPDDNRNTVFSSKHF